MKIGSPLDHLFARLTHTKSTKTKTGGGDKAGPVASSPNANSLTAQLSKAFSTLDLESESGLKQARQVLIQKILAAKFGDTIVSDSQFVLMVNTIEEEVANDKSLEQDFNEAIREVKVQ